MNTMAATLMYDLVVSQIQRKSHRRQNIYQTHPYCIDQNFPDKISPDSKIDSGMIHI